MKHLTLRLLIAAAPMLFALGLVIGTPSKPKIEPVQATQLVYMPDVSKAPTADQFNGLLHALQNAHLMQGVPVDKTPKSDWMHWWGFP